MIEAHSPGFFFDSPAGLAQALVVTSDTDVSEGSISWRLDGFEQSIALREARYAVGRFRIPLTPIEKAIDVAVTFAPQGGEVERTLCAMHPARRHTVHIVHHSHQDPGWAALPHVLRKRMIPYIDEALAEVERTAAYPEEARFRWNIEGSYLLEDYIAARSPDDHRRIFDRLRAGSLELGATYCMAQTDLAGLEELARLTEFATTLSRRFDFPLDTAFLNDVPGLAWSVPQILHKSGIRYLVWGPNQIRSLVHRSHQNPLFYFESPDGSRILVWQAPFSYLEGWSLVFADIDSAEGELEKLLGRYADEQAYPHGRVLLQTSHDFNPPAGSLSDLVAAWNERWLYPRLRMSTAREFFRSVEQDEQVKIEVRAGPFPDHWVDGHAAAAAHLSSKRQSHRHLPAAEKLATLAQRLDIPPEEWKRRIEAIFPYARHAQRPWIDYPRAELERAYKDLLMIDEHTFGAFEGADIYRGASRAHWLEKESFYAEAARTAEMVMLSATADLAREAAPAGERSITVWNTVSWPRGGPIEVSVPTAWNDDPYEVVDAETGSPVEVEVVASSRGEQHLLLSVDAVPPVGYRTLLVRPARGEPPTARSEEWSRGETVLENVHYRIEVDPDTGGLRSWYDKQAGIELIDDEAQHNLNQLVFISRQPAPFAIPEEFSDRASAEEIFAALGDYGRYMEELDRAVPAVVSVSAGEDLLQRKSIVVESRLDDYLHIFSELLLYRDAKLLEIRNRVWKQRSYEKEAAYFAFPFALKPVAIELEGPGYVVEPGKQLPGSAHDFYAVHSHALVRDDRLAIVLAPLDAPLVSVGDMNHDRWLERLDVGDGHLYSYVFNNSWYTNFPLAQEGDFLFRYRLTSQAPSRVDAARFGWEASEELVSVPVEEGQGYGKLPEAASFFELDTESVFVVGLRSVGGAGPAASAVVVRLYEAAGRGTVVRVRAPLGRGQLRRAAICDINGAPVEPLQVDAGGVALELLPYSIATVSLDFE